MERHGHRYTNRQKEKDKKKEKEKERKGEGEGAHKISQCFYMKWCLHCMYSIPPIQTVTWDPNPEMGGGGLGVEVHICLRGEGTCASVLPPWISPVVNGRQTATYPVTSYCPQVFSWTVQSTATYAIWNKRINNVRWWWCAFPSSKSKKTLDDCTMERSSHRHKNHKHCGEFYM